MNVLTIFEKDGTATRVIVPLDQIAFEIGQYFRKEIGLAAILANVEDDELVYDEEETERANLYVNEWRNFNNSRLSVVK